MCYTFWFYTLWFSRWWIRLILKPNCQLLRQNDQNVTSNWRPSKNSNEVYRKSRKIGAYDATDMEPYEDVYHFVGWKFHHMVRIVTHQPLLMRYMVQPNSCWSLTYQKQHNIDFLVGFYRKLLQYILPHSYMHSAHAIPII